MLHSWLAIRKILSAVSLSTLLIGSSLAQEGKTIFGANQQETLKAMKEISKALDVKCLHCHVKEGGKIDYKPDTAHKRIARLMKVAMIDSLVKKGSAEIELKEGEHKGKITARYHATGDSAGIHLTATSSDGKIHHKMLPAPGSNVPVTCMTCHNGQLHFITIPPPSESK